MIVAEQKSPAEMHALIGDTETVLVVGCGTCVAVCFAGGAREAAIVAAAIPMSTGLGHQEKRVADVTVQRQYEYQYLESIKVRKKNVEVSRYYGPRKFIRPDFQLVSELTSEGLSHNEHD